VAGCVHLGPRGSAGRLASLRWVRRRGDRPSNARGRRLPAANGFPAVTHRPADAPDPFPGRPPHTIESERNRAAGREGGASGACPERQLVSDPRPADPGSPCRPPSVQSAGRIPGHRGPGAGGDPSGHLAARGRFTGIREGERAVGRGGLEGAVLGGRRHPGGRGARSSVGAWRAGRRRADLQTARRLRRCSAAGPGDPVVRGLALGRTRSRPADRGVAGAESAPAADQRAALRADLDRTRRQSEPALRHLRQSARAPTRCPHRGPGDRSLAYRRVPSRRRRKLSAVGESLARRLLGPGSRSGTGTT
jgi:hypothetical protein